MEAKFLWQARTLGSKECVETKNMLQHSTMLSIYKQQSTATNAHYGITFNLNVATTTVQPISNKRIQETVPSHGTHKGERNTFGSKRLQVQFSGSAEALSPCYLPMLHIHFPTYFPTHLFHRYIIEPNILRISIARLALKSQNRTKIPIWSIALTDSTSSNGTVSYMQVSACRHPTLTDLGRQASGIRALDALYYSFYIRSQKFLAGINIVCTYFTAPCRGWLGVLGSCILLAMKMPNIRYEISNVNFEGIQFLQKIRTLRWEGRSTCFPQWYYCSGKHNLCHGQSLLSFHVSLTSTFASSTPYLSSVLRAPASRELVTISLNLATTTPMLRSSPSRLPVMGIVPGSSLLLLTLAMDLLYLWHTMELKCLLETLVRLRSWDAYNYYAALGRDRLSSVSPTDYIPTICLEEDTDKLYVEYYLLGATDDRPLTSQ